MAISDHAAPAGSFGRRGAIWRSRAFPTLAKHGAPSAIGPAPSGPVNAESSGTRSSAIFAVDTTGRLSCIGAGRGAVTAARSWRGPIPSSDNRSSGHALRSHQGRIDPYSSKARMDIPTTIADFHCELHTYRCRRAGLVVALGPGNPYGLCGRMFRRPALASAGKDRWPHAIEMMRESPRAGGCAARGCGAWPVVRPRPGRQTRAGRSFSNAFRHGVAQIAECFDRQRRQSAGDKVVVRASIAA